MKKVLIFNLLTLKSETISMNIQSIAKNIKSKVIATTAIVSNKFESRDKQFLATVTLIAGSTVVYKQCEKIDKLVVIPAIKKRMPRTGAAYEVLSNVCYKGIYKINGLMIVAATAKHMSDTVKQYKDSSKSES